MSQQTGYPPLPMFRRQMASYACAWIPMTSMRPSAKIITRCPLWRKSLMSLCTLISSPSWTSTMDTGQFSSTRSPSCSQLSTVLLEDTVSCNFPLAWSVPKTSSRRRWIRSSRSAKDALGIADDITIHGCTEVEHNAHLQNLLRITCKYDLEFNPQKTHVKAQAINFFGCLYNTDGVHPDLGKVNAIHALPVPTTSLNSKRS